MAAAAVTEIGIDEAAERSGLSGSQIKYAIKQGKMDARKSGRVFRIRTDELERYQNTREERMANEETNGITVEGSVQVTSSTDVSNEPESAGSALALRNAEGEVIWDGDWETVEDTAAEHAPANIAARQAVKKTNAAHQAAINEMREREADVRAMAAAASNRILVKGGVLDGAQEPMPE